MNNNACEFMMVR